MSYILDALKRAEKERKLGQTPDALEEVPVVGNVPGPSGRRRLLFAIGATLLLAALAYGAFRLFRHGNVPVVAAVTSPPPAESLAPAPETASVAPAPVLPLETPADSSVEKEPSAADATIEGGDSINSLDDLAGDSNTEAPAEAPNEEPAAPENADQSMDADSEAPEANSEEEVAAAPQPPPRPLPTPAPPPARPVPAPSPPPSVTTNATSAAPTAPAQQPLPAIASAAPVQQSKPATVRAQPRIRPAPPPLTLTVPAEVPPSSAASVPRGPLVVLGEHPQILEAPAASSTPAPAPAAAAASEPPAAETPAPVEKPAAPTRTPVARVHEDRLDSLRRLKEMPPAYRAEFPALTVDVHVYNADPQRSFVLINGKRYRNGDSLAEGPRIDEIVSEGIVFEWRGEKVLYALGR